MTNDPSVHNLRPGVVEYGEAVTGVAFVLQTPDQFRDNFVHAVSQASPGDAVGLEVMQFEVNASTAPIFGALTEASQRGVSDVRFHYDRVARRHIRSEDGASEAFVVMGRTAIHRGDKAALKEANSRRESLITELELLGITDRQFKRGGHQKSLSHNHVKLAFVGDTAWFGTMNLRGIDFEMSNFMVRTTDPQVVDELKGIFAQTEEGRLAEDRVFDIGVQTAEGVAHETKLLFDGGAKRQSVIFDKALEMADSLGEGDEFIMISQWPPVKVMYGALSEKLHAKMCAGVRGTFFMSPEKNLHPSRRAAAALQEQVARMVERTPGMNAQNLARQTHAKAIMIRRANGDREVLFGSHNFSSWTVRNGTRELAMWTNDPAIVDQVEGFLSAVSAEQPPEE